MGYPGASIVASQPWIEYFPHGWQIPTTLPWAPIPGTRHTDETEEGRKIRDGRQGEDAKDVNGHFLDEKKREYGYK